MIQPYTKADLERGEKIVRELHGLTGFDAWAERIAKEIAAERERLRHALATIRDDLSSVTITGDEIHNIIAGINDVLDRKE